MNIKNNKPLNNHGSGLSTKSILDVDSQIKHENSCSFPKTTQFPLGLKCSNFKKSQQLKQDCPYLKKFLYGKSVAYFDVSRGDKGKFYSLNIYKNKMLKISKSEFNLSKLAHVEFKHSFYLYNSGTKAQILSYVKHLPSNWQAESLVTDVTNNVSGFIHLLKSLADAGNFTKSASSFLKNMYGKSQNFYQTHKHDFKMFILELSSLLLKFTEFINSKISITLLLDSLLSFYKLFCLTTDLKNKWQAESMVSLTISVASMFMPKSVFEIFKRMSTFSNSKILDDVSGAFQLYVYLTQFIKAIISHLPFSLPPHIADALNKMFSVEHYQILNDINKVYDIWYSNRRIVLEESYRAKIKEMKILLDNTPNLDEIQRRSPGMKIIVNKFTKLYKCVLSYESSSRVEPVCYIWEGKPGTTKSKFMSAVIGASKNSSYAHTVKSVDEGKEFHDNYNEEDIYYIDDIGQQGKSQFRTLINLVSSVKMPLDCASVELKDTKFFTSNKIFMTTNEFMTLNGFTKTDCVADKKALWRRANVFSFDQVQIHQGYVTGKISHNYFDVITSKWIEGFPRDQQDYHRLHNLQIPSSIEATEDNFLHTVAWMTVIINNASEMKSEQKRNNDLQPEDLSQIDTLIANFTAESDCPPSYEEYVKMYLHMHTNNQSHEWSKTFVKAVFLDIAYYVKYLITYVSESLNINDIGDVFNIISIVIVVVTLITAFTENITANIPFEEDECCKNGHYDGEGNSVAIPYLSPLDKSSTHTAVAAVSKQVYDIKLISKVDDIAAVSGVGFINGRYIMTTHHTCIADEAYIVVYQNKSIDQRLIDHMKVTIAYRNSASDIAVWKIPDNYPLPFKKLNVCSNLDKSNKAYLVTPEGIVGLDRIPATPVTVPTPYEFSIHNQTIVNHIKPTDFFYSVRGKGLCGSLVLSHNGKLLGLHVAGNEKSIGSALKIPYKVLEDLNNLFTNKDKGLVLDVEISEKIAPNTSGIKVVSNLAAYSQKKTDYVKTRLTDVFPTTRRPADLSVYGSHTVKDVAKKSFKNVTSIDEDEIKFASSCINLLVEKSKPITMREVILGTPILAGMNKKSSNGFNNPATKEECLDYEKGELKPEFKKSYEQFINDLHKGNITLEDVVSVETLKDEIRNNEKEAPRSFRVSRLHFQILMKQLFGGMVANIIDQKWFNQIMVGINPFKDWRRMFDTIGSHSVWAGDIKSWDGNMLPQVQQAVSQLLVDNLDCSEKEKDLANKILGFSIYCPVIINDTTFITTHSMPSGIFLTAIMNSLINRFYTAMWYYRQMHTVTNITPVSFLSDVGDFVYGDDKINFVRKPELKPHLNALTMSAFFESIGMGFTTADKQVVTKPFEDLSEISFLKRKFVYHKAIGDIVGPLELRTVYSGLSWSSKKKDEDQVMADKLSAFQREMFLHEELHERDVDILENECEKQHIPFVRLPSSYLVNLYLSDSYNESREKYGIKF